MLKKISLSIILILIPILIFAQEINEKDAFLMAKDSYENGSYGVSLDLFRRFIKDYPQSKLSYEAQLYIGQCLFQNNDFIQARDILTKLEESYVPFSITDRLLFWLGQVYLKVKDLPKADSYLKKLIDTHPESNLLVSAKLQLAKVLFQEGKYNEAQDLFESLSESSDIAVREEAMFEKGRLFYERRDYQAVLKNYGVFSQVFLDSAKLADAYFYMGEASYYLEDFVKSIEYYSKAQETSNEDSTQIMCFEAMGWSYLKLDKLKQAEQSFLEIDKFLDIGFNKENLFFGKAILYSRLNNFEQAINYYDKLIAATHNNDTQTLALFGKAECLKNLLDLEEARKMYLQVIDRGREGDNKEIKDSIVKSHYNLGWIALNRDDLELALSEFQKAYSLSEDKEVRLSALSNIADIHRESGEFNKAIEIYAQVLRDYPDNSYNDYIQYHLGISLLASAQYELAASSFIEFNKNFSQSSLLDDANYYLGYSYFKDKKYKNACEQLQNFLGVFLNSEYKDKAIYLLAISFYNRGMFKEAINNFKETIKEFNQDKDLVQKCEYEIANALYQAGEETQAINRFSEFIIAYPNSQITPSIIFWLGQHYYQDSKFELARDNFRSLIQKYPQHSLSQEARYNIGLSFLAEKKSEQAIETFKELVGITKSQQLKAKTMLAIGDLLLEQNRQDEAIRTYNELTQLISSNNIYSSTATQITQDNEEGESKLKNIEYPQDIINYSKATILYQADQGEGSDNSEIKFVKLAFMRLAELYRKDKDFSKAIYVYSEALKYPSDENDAQIQFKIAECLEEDHKIDESLEAYSKISDNYKQDKQWIIKGLLRSALIYENRENWQEAARLYGKIITYNVAEAKYAQERIDSIKRQIKFD